MDPNFDASASAQPQEESASRNDSATKQESGGDEQITMAEDTAPNNQAFSLAAHNQNHDTIANTALPPSSFPQDLSRLNDVFAISSEQRNTAVALEPSLPLTTQSTSAAMVDASPPAPAQNRSIAEDSGAIRSDLSAPNDSSTALSNSLNIQAFLDDLAAPSNASTAPESDTMTATTSQTTLPNAPETIFHPEIQAARAPKDPFSPTPLTSPNLPPRPPSQTSPDDTVAQEIPVPMKLEPATEGEKLSLNTNAAFAPLAHAAPPPLPTAGAPGVQAPPSLPVLPSMVPMLSSQPVSHFLGTLSSAQGVKVEDSAISRPGEDVSKGLDADENLPWAADTQRQYDDFLAAERKYVLEGNWDKFPIGSRLFLGNLPSEKVTKRDLFHVFHRYGKLAQISIKQAYGFVQYLDATQCARAMAAEQGVAIRGKGIHLEISVPGGKKRNQRSDGRAARNRRSRSPAGSRSGGRNSRSDNRYRPRSPDRHRGRTDDYGGRRSRSPRQYQNSHRSVPSNDSRLPLPYRAPQQIPDVQVIAKDPIERNFVQYMESSFAQRSLRADVLYLAPGLEEQQVVRRQIMEGVLAVVKVDRLSMAVQRFHLTVFDRSGGINHVQFAEYNNLDIRTVIELVSRAKQNANPPSASLQGSFPQSAAIPPQMQASTYQYQNQGPGSAAFLGPQVPSTTPAQPPQTMNSAGPENLQAILQSLARQPQTPASGVSPMQQAQLVQYQQQQQAPQNKAPELAQILAAVQQNSGGQQHNPNAANAGATQSSAQNQQQQLQTPTGGSASVPDMSQIMAQLNRYGR